MIVGTGNHRYKAVPSWGAERTLGIASQDRVYVVDREPNNRIQILAPDGTFMEEWKGRPTARTESGSIATAISTSARSASKTSSTSFSASKRPPRKSAPTHRRRR